jgi:hypothetical protein
LVLGVIGPGSSFADFGRKHFGIEGLRRFPFHTAPLA